MMFSSRPLLSFGMVVVSLALSMQGCATSGASKAGKGSLSDRERAELLVQAASAALVEGDPTGALQLLKQAEEHAPKMPEIFLARSSAYYAKKETAAAVESVRHAILLNPQYGAARNTLGKLLLDQGKLAEAEKELQIATQDKLSRELYKPYINLGILYYRQGKNERSQAALDKAIVEGKDAACVAYYYRGHLRLKAADYAEAIRDYTSATRRVCGNFADAHLALATTYERSRQYDMARKKYLDIQQHFPNTQVAEEAMSRLRNVP